MKFDKIVSKLCTPAYLYFFISTIVFVIVLTQNIFNGNVIDEGFQRKSLHKLGPPPVPGETN